MTLGVAQNFCWAKGALQQHSLSDKWLFPFLAKLITMARSAIGQKTSSEITVEDAIIDSKLGRSGS